MQARFILFVLAAVLSYTAAEMCAGCPMKHNPSEFNKEKLAQVLSAYGSNEAVAKIVSYSTQVVSGIKYVVTFETASGKTCEASWVDAPWESELPLDTQLSCRVKRSVLGGFQDVDEKEMPLMAAYGEAAANEGVNGYRKVVVKVVKAQKKVTSATIYKINYIVKTTSCKMEDVPNEVCLSKEVGQREACQSTIRASTYIVHGGLQNLVLATECRAVVGGKLITGHDQEEMEYAERFAVAHANMQINSLNYKGLFKVLSVDEKLSAGGKLFTFKFVLRETDCVKSQNVPLNGDNCPVKDNTHVADDVCSVTVWYWPSTKFMQVRASACASASSS